MYRACAPVRVMHHVDQSTKEARVFLGAMTVEDASGTCIERSGEVVLDVLAWGQHEVLLAPLHIGETNFRIQVNVSFIDVQHFFLRAASAYQGGKIAKDFSTPAHWNAQRGTRPAPSAFFLL